MGSWRKLLAAMAADTDPRSYTYDEASRVLDRLGFGCAKSSGSHRLWKREIEKAGKPHTVVIGLLDKGTGRMKPEYIKQLVQTLREEGLLPTGDDDALDD